MSDREGRRHRRRRDGRGIAAHVANAGVPVVLLDIVPPKEPTTATRSRRLPSSACSRPSPAPFMSKAAARLVTAGNLEDDLASARGLRLDRRGGGREPGGQARALCQARGRAQEGLDLVLQHLDHPACQADGGPARALRAGTSSSRISSTRRATCAFSRSCAGPSTRKTAIAKRSGASPTCGSARVSSSARTRPASSPTASACCGSRSRSGAPSSSGSPSRRPTRSWAGPWAFPRPACSACLDLVGIDLMPHVAASMRASLPAGDLYRSLFKRNPARRQDDRGGLYRPQRQGRLLPHWRKDGGERVKESIDLKTGALPRRSTKPQLESIEAARKARAQGTRRASGQAAAQYAWRVLSHTLAYAAALVPEIADDDSPRSIRRCGLATTGNTGPSSSSTSSAPAWFAEKLKAAGMPVPPLLAARGRPTLLSRSTTASASTSGLDGEYTELARRRACFCSRTSSAPPSRLRGTARPRCGISATAWLCLEFTQQDERARPRHPRPVQKAIKLVKRRSTRRWSIYNEGDNFSVGANLGLALFAANIGAVADDRGDGGEGPGDLQGAEIRAFPGGRGALRHGARRRLRDPAPLRAPCRRMPRPIWASSRSGVGLVPGWGGCKEMLTRWLLNPKRPRRADAARSARPSRRSGLRQGGEIRRRGQGDAAACARATASP